MRPKAPSPGTATSPGIDNGNRKEFENGAIARRFRTRSGAPRRIAVTPGSVTRSPLGAAARELQQIVDVLKSDEPVGRSRRKGFPGDARGESRRQRRESRGVNRQRRCSHVRRSNPRIRLQAGPEIPRPRGRAPLRAPASRRWSAKTAPGAAAARAGPGSAGCATSAFDDVLAKLEPVLGRVAPELGARDVEQRPDHAVRPAAGCRRARPAPAPRIRRSRKVSA